MDSRKTVLAVDDDAEMLQALTHALETAGYRVLARSDVGSALEALAAGEPVDLVISDVRLPGLKGTSLLSAVKTAQPALPVILITAFGHWGQYQQSLEAGVFEYLCKPVDKAILLDCVRRALAGEAPAPRVSPPWDSY